MLSGAILPNGWQRGVLQRDQEDRGVDGELQESHRSQDQGDQGGWFCTSKYWCKLVNIPGLRGRGDRVVPC